MTRFYAFFKCRNCQFKSEVENHLINHLQEKHQLTNVEKNAKFIIRDNSTGDAVPLEGLSYVERKQFYSSLEETKNSNYESRCETARLKREQLLREVQGANASPTAVKNPTKFTQVRGQKRNLETSTEAVRTKFARLQIRKQSENRVTYSCRECDRAFSKDKTGYDQLQAHIRGAHHFKNVCYVCKICVAHFTAAKPYLGHFMELHQAEVKKGQDASAFCRVIFGQYQLIPFCKECGYANFYLFKNKLGCLCKDKRPKPGSALEWDLGSTVEIDPLKNIKYSYEGETISHKHVCAKTGSSFKAPDSKSKNLSTKELSGTVANENSKPNVPAPKRTPKIVLTRMETSEGSCSYSATLKKMCMGLHHRPLKLTPLSR